MVGGAVRNALLRLSVGEIDVATTAVPEEVIRRVIGGRLESGSDRNRSWHRHCDHRRQAIRGDDIAAGCRDLWPQGQGCVRPRLAHRRAAARFHHQRPVGRRRRHSLRLCRRALPILPRGACASLARRRSGLPKIICASCGSFAFTPGMAPAPPMPQACTPASVARAGLETLSRERMRMELLKLLLAAACDADARGHGRMRHSRHGARRRAVARELREHGESRGGDRSRRRRRRAGWARLAFRSKRTASGSRSGYDLSNAEAERLMALEGWWRVAPGSDGQAARALLYRLGPRSFTDRCCLPGRARLPAPPTRRGTSLPICRSAGPRRFFRSRLPTSFSAASAAGPALGAALRAAEKAWIAADFPGERGALETIADTTAREVATDG